MEFICQQILGWMNYMCYIYEIGKSFTLMRLHFIFTE